MKGSAVWKTKERSGEIPLNRFNCRSLYHASKSKERLVQANRITEKRGQSCLKAVFLRRANPSLGWLTSGVSVVDIAKVWR
jgi:hypothetical protein